MKAIAVDKQCLRIDPGNGETRTRAAELFEELGRAAEAVAEATQALRAAVPSRRARRVLGRLLPMDGRATLRDALRRA